MEHANAADQEKGLAQLFRSKRREKDEPQDFKEAVSRFRKGADQGSPSAQYNLGVMFYHGQGAQQNYEEAAKWYKHAAEQGYPAAQNELGWMLFLGQGIPKDNIQALMWITLAAKQGEQQAMRTRHTISKKMTPDQIALSEELASKWAPTVPVTAKP